LNRVTSFAYDSAGRITQQTLPDSRVVGFGYDANGNTTSVTPPGRPAHSFAYTSIDLLATYTPPAVAGTGPTQYAYNLDRQPTTITRPDGLTLAFAYDAAGRPSALTIPTGQYAYAYNATTGNLTNITAPGANTLAYSYDGALLTGTTWGGTITGAVSQTFNNNFRISSQSVNGAGTVNFTYDDDNLLTGAGSLTLTRHAQNGLITATSLGSVTDARGHNNFGEMTSHSASFNAASLYAVAYTRDKLGRIAQKTETIGGVTSVYDYAYDPAGRLTQVKKDSVTISTYTYDSNDNRLSHTDSGGAVNGAYDNQDRLTQYGPTTYAYTANGELSSKTAGAQTTTYSYDVIGNLRNVTLPGGTQIEYVIDGQNRRVGKKVNGALTRGWLYQDQLKPIAELDSGNNVVSRFVYGSQANAPDYMIKGGETYRLISDHLGSVRLVVNVATGVVAQRLDYDEFGVVTMDTNPGFQPFGFAGGLYDQQTGLTRFGARDYDAETGRWTAKDPFLFAGGDTNLYGYVANDPINLVDPLGAGGIDASQVSQIDPNNELMGVYSDTSPLSLPTLTGIRKIPKPNPNRQEFQTLAEIRRIPKRKPKDKPKQPTKCPKKETEEERLKREIEEIKQQLRKNPELLKTEKGARLLYDLQSKDFVLNERQPPLLVPQFGPQIFGPFNALDIK
jgi:RHS repeat-associated protein